MRCYRKLTITHTCTQTHTKWGGKTKIFRDEVLKFDIIYKKVRKRSAQQQKKLQRNISAKNTVMISSGKNGNCILTAVRLGTSISLYLSSCTAFLSTIYTHIINERKMFTLCIYMYDEMTYSDNDIAQYFARIWASKGAHFTYNHRTINFYM